MDDWEKAGKITAEAREFGRKLVKENALALEIAEKIEKKMIDLGAKPAFPVDVSINHIAAHASPLINDQTKIKKGDLVKLDLGASVNGCIGDSACTVEVGTKKYEKMIQATEEALKEALKLAKPNTKVCEIGDAIQKKIEEYGYTPIHNLSGHEIKPYIIHAGITVPNFNNNDKRELKEGMIVAIEPFATDGEGRVMEGKPSNVFSLENIKPIRNINARKVLSYIQKNYKTMPFSARWLKFPNINFILRILEKEGIIKQYPQLVERRKGFVTQAEHTIKVGEKVLTA